MGGLESSRLDKWYMVFTAFGAALAVAAVATSSTAFATIGLSLFAVGIGEWINHPLRTTFVDARQGLSLALTN